VSVSSCGRTLVPPTTGMSGITNIAVHGVDRLAGIVKQRLRACQQQTDLLASFLAQTAITGQTPAFQPL